MKKPVSKMKKTSVLSKKTEKMIKTSSAALQKQLVNAKVKEVESYGNRVKFFYFKYNTPDHTPQIIAVVAKRRGITGKEYIKVAFSIRNPKDKYNKNLGKLNALNKLTGCPEHLQAIDMEYYGDTMAQTAMAFNMLKDKPSFVRGYTIPIYVDKMDELDCIY